MVDVPANYLLFNEELTKNISLVVKIEGVPDLLTNRPIFKKIRYGDPDIHYGDPGLVYGGLTRVPNVKDYLSLDGSSITISQLIEPERGKGSVSQFSLSFVDVGQYMSNLIAPGNVIPDILGAQVSVFLGYQEIAWPEDYFQIFRGYITKVNSKSGMVTFGISDPNVKRRTSLFFTPKNNLTAPVTDVATTIPFNTGDYNQKILGPDGTYDPAIRLYVLVESEFIEYTNATVTPTALVGVTRGARGTTPAAHDVTATADAVVQIEDKAVSIALKLMLSGWNGYWKTNVSLASILYSTEPLIGNIQGAFVLPDGVDAVRDYGIIEGDYVTTTGATNGANNVTLAKIVRFNDISDQKNRIIITDAVGLVAENPTPAVMSLRSKYDTYPTNCGLKMTEQDVDIARHEYFETTFLNQPFNSYRFLITDQVTGKDFIEEQVYLPIGAYSITRNGKVSMGMTKPPLAGQSLIVLSINNLTNVENIAPERSTNNRKFYNEIDYDFDFNDQGNATSLIRVLDSNSLNIIGIGSVLPIVSKGARTDLGAPTLFNKRSQLMLTRFKNGAVYFDVEPLWTQANQIESGDVVGLKDNGQLQLSNFSTGKRDLGFQLYEVVNRQLDIKTGRTKISLVNGIGAEATDRYGTIGPSSVIGTGSTTSSIIITDSFGAIFPGDEQKKWVNYIGETVLIHDQNWTFQEERTLVGFDPFNIYQMNIDPPLSISPPAGYIVDQPPYSSSNDPTVNQVWKQINDSFSPRVAVTSGTSVTKFDVGAGDVGKFFIGSQVLVHNDNFSVMSPEAKVTDITGTTITVSPSLGFVPTSADKVDLIGFPDKSGSYRWI